MLNSKGNVAQRLNQGPRTIPGGEPRIQHGHRSLCHRTSHQSGLSFGTAGGACNSPGLSAHLRPGPSLLPTSGSRSPRRTLAPICVGRKRCEKIKIFWGHGAESGWYHLRSNYLLTHFKAAAEAFAVPGSLPLGLFVDVIDGLCPWLLTFKVLMPFVVETRRHRGHNGYSSTIKAITD